MSCSDDAGFNYDLTSLLIESTRKAWIACAVDHADEPPTHIRRRVVGHLDNRRWTWEGAELKTLSPPAPGEGFYVIVEDDSGHPIMWKALSDHEARAISQGMDLTLVIEFEEDRCRSCGRS